MKASILSRGGLAVCALLAAACARDLTQPTPPATPRADVTPAAGSYIVAFSAGIPSGFGAQVAALGGSVSYTHDGAGIAVVDGLSDTAASALATAAGVSYLAPDLALALDDPAGSTTLDASSLAGASQGNPASALVYGWQWNMRAIHADQAWAAGKLGSPGVTVAIVDSGIDYDAADLVGLVDLSRSVSFVAKDNLITQTYFPFRNPVQDYNGHGTFVATQVASNAHYLAGVSSKTTLIGVKVGAYNNTSNLGRVIRGLLWAADHGADVANVSIVGTPFGTPRNQLPTYNAIFYQIFTYLARQGMLVVVAAGNASANLDQDGNLIAPFCDVPTVICVSATGPLTWGGNPDLFAYYSNYGSSAIDVAAPGGNADAANGFPFSSWPWGTDNLARVWGDCSKTYLAGLTSTGVPILTPCVSGKLILGALGTSAAAPHVAGLAALLIAQLGRGNPAQIKTLIQNTADDLGKPGMDPYYGHGRINVARALGL